MGGVVPLGYRVEARKLLVDEQEAATIRLIFQRYLDLGSLPALQRDLRDRGIRTRPRVLASGLTVGDVPLTNGPLCHILKNRMYLGELNHKGVSYKSEHQAIVPLDLFDAVQARLAQNLNRSDLRKGKTGALLMGRIVDDHRDPMSPSHTNKNGVRYRYYVSSTLVQGRSKETGAVRRLPAHEVETIVMASLRAHLMGAFDWEANSDADLVQSVDLRVKVRRGQLELTWRPKHRNPARANTGDDEGATAELVRNRGEDQDRIDPERQRLIIPYAPQPHKRQRAIIVPDDASGPVAGLRLDEQRNLLRALAKGHALLKEVLSADHVDFAAIAKREGRSERSIRATLSLAFLDPKLVRASVAGTLPRGFGAKRLINLPSDWHDQWRALGLARPV